MVHREDAEGVIVISQPAHAWVSGQIGHAWGNQTFPCPAEETRLAAEQHDVGFLDWERSPTLNPQTGRPHTFLDMPLETHLGLWTTGIQRMLRFARYPALLVSLHFTELARRTSMGKTPSEREAVARFLGEQDTLQTTLTTSLRNDFHYAALSSDEAIHDNQRLVSLWDWMSLLLCTRFRLPNEILPFPAEDGVECVEMLPLNAEGTRVSVKPWPFRNPDLRIVCEGRRLLKTYSSEEEMREGLRAAARVAILIDLVPV
jgi:hypothetical protein